MHKLMLIFRRPQDEASFGARWSQEFVPRAERMPGIRRVAVSWIRGGPAGPVDLHLVHELYFEDGQAAQRAMTSPQGQEAGEALMAFAGDLVTVCFAEHMEEERAGAAQVPRPSADES